MFRLSRDTCAINNVNKIREIEYLRARYELLVSWLLNNVSKCLSPQTERNVFFFFLKKTMKYNEQADVKE